MPFLTIIALLTFSSRQCRDCKQKGVETKLSPCGCRLCSKCWGAWHLDSSECTTPCDNCGTSHPHREFQECTMCEKAHCTRPSCLETCMWDSTCPSCMETSISSNCIKKVCDFGSCGSCWNYFHHHQCP